MADPMERVSCEKKGTDAAYVASDSGQTEFVALRIGHHQERIVRVIGSAKESSAKILDPSSEHVPLLFTTGGHVQMDSVLDRLRFGDTLEVEPRSHPRRINDGRAGRSLLRAHTVGCV